jgi:hypothetical protein
MKRISKADKLRLNKLKKVIKVLTNLDKSIYRDQVNYDDTIAVELNQRISYVMNRIDEIADIVGTPTNEQETK